MEIKILHHPSQEAAARRIGEVLSSNGIASQLKDSAEAPNGLHISVANKATAQEKTQEAATLLASSFVDVDSTPGY